MIFLFGTGGKKKALKKIVNDWEKSQVSNIAKEIVKLVPQQAPFLRDIAATALAGLINKNLVFLAGEAQQSSRDIYSIIDTVRVRVGPELPFLGKQFTISINYNVQVNLKERKVVEGKPDVRSLKIDFL